jgi:hypothetical protein
VTATNSSKIDVRSALMLPWYLSLMAATNSVRVDMLIRLAIRCPEDAPPWVASSLRQRI